MQLKEKIEKEFDKELLEKLADIEHQRWSSWQKYMHSRCVKMIDVDDETKEEKLREVTIPLELFKGWERQIDTDYKELTEKEKDSDREQVKRYDKHIKQFIIDKIKEIVCELVGKEKTKKDMVIPKSEDIGDFIMGSYEHCEYLRIKNYNEFRKKILNKLNKEL